MTSVASGFYVEGPTWLHDRHPVTKLLGLLFVLVAAFLLAAGRAW